MTEERVELVEGTGCVPGAHGKARPAHTPTPWHVENMEPRTIGIEWIPSADMQNIADCPDPTAMTAHGLCGVVDPDVRKANAVLIVRAVNAHADLVAALREARVYVADEIRELLMSFCVLDDGGDPIIETLSADDAPFVEKARGVLARIDAALAKAQRP